MTRCPQATWSSRVQGSSHVRADDGGDGRLPPEELLHHVGDEVLVPRRGSRRCSSCWARNAKKRVSESVTVSRPAVSSTKQMSSISSHARRSAPGLGDEQERGEDVVASTRPPARRTHGVEVRVDVLRGGTLDRPSVPQRCRRFASPGRGEPVAHARSGFGSSAQGRVSLHPEGHERRQELGELVGEVARTPVDERVDEPI